MFIPTSRVICDRSRATSGEPLVARYHSSKHVYSFLKWKLVQTSSKNDLSRTHAENLNGFVHQCRFVSNRKMSTSRRSAVAPTTLVQLLAMENYTRLATMTWINLGMVIRRELPPLKRSNESSHLLPSGLGLPESLFLSRFYRDTDQDNELCLLNDKLNQRPEWLVHFNYRYISSVKRGCVLCNWRCREILISYCHGLQVWATMQTNKG
jgi:hypothetical protein